MAKPEHLPNAPIVEAAIDIRVDFSQLPDQAKLASFQDVLSDRYPQKQVRTEWEGQIKFRKGADRPITETSGGPVGYIFRSADGKNVVQARPNGFGFSRLKPYEDWDSFSKEARALWGKYRSLTKPKKVVRLGVRYINQMALPLPLTDFREYLLTAPQIAPGLPQAVANFFFRVVLPDEKSKALVAVIETVDESHSNQNSLSIILDIDVFRTGAFPVEPDKLWPMMLQLRDVKNNVFFSSITERAKELFK